MKAENSPQMPNSKLKSWLASDEGRTVVRKAAERIMSDVQTKGLSLRFLHMEDYSTESEQLLEEITSELGLFILEKSEKWQKSFDLENPHAHTYLKNAFLNHWKSATRNAANDPKRHLYRRFQTLLKGEPGFFIQISPHQGTAFSRVENSEKIQPLEPEDLEAVPFPLTVNDYDGVNRKSALIQLATCFWDQVRDMWNGRPVWVDIRDLVNWVAQSVFLGVPVRIQGQDDEAEPLSLVASESPGPDCTPFEPEQIRKAARGFIAKLDKNARIIFYLSQTSDLSLREIAAKTGYKGSSGPKYVLEKVLAQLRKTLKPRPEYAPDAPYRDEAFSLFLNTVVSCLKKEMKMP